MKLIKDNVIREIIGEDTIKIFLECGWEKYKKPVIKETETKKKEEKIEIKK